MQSGLNESTVLINYRIPSLNCLPADGPISEITIKSKVNYQTAKLITLRQSQASLCWLSHAFSWPNYCSNNQAKNVMTHLDKVRYRFMLEKVRYAVP